MIDKEQESTVPKPSPEDDGYARQKAELFPLSSLHQKTPAEGVQNSIKEQLKALALPKSPFDEFTAALKPFRDHQKQLEAFAPPRNPLAEFEAAMKPFRDHQKKLEAFSPPRNPLAEFEAAMKPQRDLQEHLKALPTSRKQLTEIKETSELGKLIRKKRENNGMTQQQLSDLAGVGRRFLSELENGKQSLEFGKVIKVAAAIGIDLLAKQR